MQCEAIENPNIVLGGAGIQTTQLMLEKRVIYVVIETLKNLIEEAIKYDFTIQI